jgi:two-component system sensor histidine kinase RpfC
MVINRLIIGPLVLIYLAVAYWLETPGVEQEFFLVISVYVGASVAIALDLARRPGVSVLRRYLAMATDLGVLSYGLHVGGGITSVLYPIYLWTIFGNGFRFGMRYLFAATAMSVAGFAFVVRHSDYWLANPQLALGLLAGLVILPLYASTLIRKLSDAKAVAEEASRAKSLFLASVSHELRTPLNAVIATSDLLRESDLDREEQDMASMIGVSARSLLSLIDELLNFSRLEAGRMPVNEAPFDLDGLLAEVRGMLMPQARAKGLSLNLRIATETPASIKSDKSHLREVLVNLTGNALKFTEKGSVRICVEPTTGEEGDTLLRFEVSDTGIGIAEESLARIFDSFTQADDSIINRYGGTGLGLAICKQLIDLHGGRIGVDSEPGKGSTFWFEMPVDPVEGVAATAATADYVGVVVGPDAAGRERLAEQVRARGIAVQCAANRGELLDILEAVDAGGKGRPFVLIDGAHEECAAIAHDLAARETAMPLPAVVAYADPEAREAAPDYFIATLPLPLPDAELDRALHMVAAAQIGTSKPIADAVKASSGRRFTILVADDNATNQKVIGKILERAGHAARMANNGEEAVDLLMAEPFDLVLMDINMPVMDGIEATKLYRFASLGRERVPILALTADATSEARARCLDAGMDGCVTKPIEPAKLLQLVDETVARKPGDNVRMLDETVADLAAHPRFRGENKPVLDRATLEELKQLGGESFVAEVIAAFISESTRILHDIDMSVAENDVQAFHERTHALRSGAANIGARRFYETCLAVRAIEADDFTATGKKHAAQLRAEFESAVEELDPTPGGRHDSDSVARLSGERSRR